MVSLGAEPGVNGATRLVSGCRDGSLSAWEVRVEGGEEAGVSVRALGEVSEAHSESVCSLLLEGSWLATGSRGVIAQWTLGETLCRQSVWRPGELGRVTGSQWQDMGRGVLPSHWVRTLCQGSLGLYSGCQRQLTVPSSDCQDALCRSGLTISLFQLWDVETSQAVRSVEIEEGSLYSLLPLEGGALLACATSEGHIEVAAWKWSVREGIPVELREAGSLAEVGRLSGPEGTVQALCRLPDGRVASGGQDCVLRVRPNASLGGRKGRGGRCGTWVRGRWWGKGSATPPPSTPSPPPPTTYSPPHQTPHSGSLHSSTKQRRVQITLFQVWSYQ